MKAVRVHEYKQPPRIDEVPQPDLADHHDVIVRIGGAGVCRTDLHLVDGWFEDVMPVEAPFTLGHENAGWVEAVGDAVTSVRVGQTVIFHPLATCGVCWGCRHGEDMYCASSAFHGVNADGGYAEYMRAPERSLVVLPEELAPADVAPYADAGLTAYRAVRKAAKLLQAGDTAVVIGVGGLGHIGVQLLGEMTPAQIVGVDKAESGRALASEVGAHAVFSPETALDELTELTGGRGATVVIDFVGEGDAPALAASLLGAGGTYLIVGYGGELTLPTMEIVLKEISIVGNLVGNYADLGELMALARDGRVNLHTKTYALTDAVQALDDLENGRIKGRAVLVP
jgi:NAD+-dependent secondary alcohol dehydrogenase Adh1